MPTYDVMVKVHYYYEVQADNDVEAEKLGWMYEDHPYSAEVYEITVEEQDEEDEEGEVGDLEDE